MNVCPLPIQFCGSVPEFKDLVAVSLCFWGVWPPHCCSPGPIATRQCSNFHWDDSARRTCSPEMGKEGEWRGREPKWTNPHARCHGCWLYYTHIRAVPYTIIILCHCQAVRMLLLMENMQDLERVINIPVYYAHRNSWLFWLQDSKFCDQISRTWVSITRLAIQANSHSHTPKCKCVVFLDIQTCTESQNPGKTVSEWSNRRWKCEFCVTTVRSTVTGSWHLWTTNEAWPRG